MINEKIKSLRFYNKRRSLKVLETDLTRTLKIRYPIFQAPMAGGVSTPELVAAVSNAGGLGNLGGGYLTPEQLRSEIQKSSSERTGLSE